MHVAEEMDDVLGPRQQRQIFLDDDTVETVVYKSQQAAEQLAEGFHRSSPGAGLDTHDHRTEGRWKSRVDAREGFPRTEGLAEGASVDLGGLSNHGNLPAGRIIRADQSTAA